MAQLIQGPTRAANDGFERYYAEKLWEWIPEAYRDADGRDDNPGKGTLRALVELIADQAAVIRRDVDRLWDDQQITLADDWAVPYIGDLLGTRPVSEQNRRGQRVAVARTVHYRRRKGTLPVLEALIRDIGDLDGAVAEAFRRLGRTRHRLDPELPGLEGLITRTPLEARRICAAHASRTSSSGRSTTSRTPWTPGSCVAPTAATTSRRSISTCSRCRRSRCASRRGSTSATPVSPAI